MRVVVCGGRKYANRDKLYAVLDELRKHGEMELGVGYDPKSPTYQGADQLAYEWAKDRGVPGKAYPAHWQEHGNAAGPRRNQRMLDQFRPELVVAFPGGRGTADCVQRAQSAKIEVRLADTELYD